MERENLDVRPIMDEDADAVAMFLRDQLNPRVSLAAWGVLLAPPWKVDAPNHGFQLIAGGAVVGAYVAVYAEREIDGERRRFCNLAAFCVLEEYRAHSVRLIRAMLAQRGFEFTDLSPSGNVVALNQRLGFAALDTATRVTLNLPGIPRRGVTVSGDPTIIERTLTERDASVYRDHRGAPAARHIVAITGDQYGYLIVRKDRRKRLPFFVSPLYVGGSRDVLRSAWREVSSHLLVRHGMPAMLAERRVLGFVPSLGVNLRTPRAKMFRSRELPADAVDYLYSELTLLEW
ncbi:MAG: hypothetical protein ABWX59_11920 [Microbacteriaceae bacterium]